MDVNQRMDHIEKRLDRVEDAQKTTQRTHKRTLLAIKVLETNVGSLTLAIDSIQKRIEQAVTIPKLAKIGGALFILLQAGAFAASIWAAWHAGTVTLP